MKKSSAVVLAHAILFFAVAGFFSLAPSAFAKNPQAAAHESKEPQHAVYGTIRSVEGATLTVETRDKKMVKVNTKAAAEGQRTGVLIVGRTVLIHGTYDAKGTFQASAVQRAKSSSALWPEDK
jgi:hypothetical protein